MDSKQETWPLLTFKDYEKDIDPNPVYQREEVWRQEQKNLLIDSVLRKIDIPKIYLRQLPPGQHKYEIIDGQQRMRSFWDFLNDKFALDDEAKDLDVDGQVYSVAGCKYSDLDHALRIERIHKCALNVVIVTEATEDEIADLFYRLNNGTPLSSAEVRNAMPGEVTKLVRRMATHGFFLNCAFKNRRMAYDQVAAMMLCVELYGGITEVGDNILSKMFNDYSRGVPEKTIETFKKNLDLLGQIFPEKSRLLKRTSVLNMYLLLSYLGKHSRLARATREIRKWFEQTEPERLRRSDYKSYMTKSVNNRVSVDGRFSILLLDYLKSHERFDIVQLDERRTFTEEQKIEMYKRDNGMCQKCGKKVKEYQWHADHVRPWFEGGRTETENGQVLCVRCSLKKGAKLWE